MTGKVDITLNINGRDHSISVEPRRTLADAIRENCGQTGTHIGCEHGVCGACTVRIDGVACRACLTLAVQVDGRQVDTVEGLTQADGALNDLQQAFKRHHALQCGFCTAGILMSCADWLDRQDAPGAAPHEPTEAEVRDMLSGHICRCTGYTPIVAAVLEVARARHADRKVSHA